MLAIAAAKQFRMEAERRIHLPRTHSSLHSKRKLLKAVKIAVFGC